MNQIEEKFYEMAGEELVAKQVIRGVWAKAFATAQGDEAKTKAAYIELRVAQLRKQLQEEQEARLQEQLRERIQEQAREQLQEQQRKQRGIAASDADKRFVEMERLSQEVKKQMAAKESTLKVCKSCLHCSGNGYRGFCAKHQKKVSYSYICTDFIRRAP